MKILNVQEAISGAKSQFNALQLEQATASVMRILAANPEVAMAHFMLGEILLLQGDLKTGFIEYEWRLKINSKSNYLLNKPLWAGERVESILLIGDQGFGDTIQFARYIPMVAQRCKNVVIACDRQLKSLLSTIEGVGKIHLEGEPQCDAYAPLTSLPFIFKTELGSIPASVPYVKADPEKTELWKLFLNQNLPPQNLRVGISWAGRPTHPNDKNRSMSLSQCAPLFDHPNASFISLQRDIPNDDKTFFNSSGVLDVSSKLTDFSETAALIANLDLIICVDTSIAHLAGALGKPVWILLPWRPDWRWMLDRKDSPWYPSAQLFRQKSAEDWSSVVTKVRTELAKRVKDKTRNPTANSAIRNAHKDTLFWANSAPTERARRAADYISTGATVIDINSNDMVLERFLPEGCQYIPCDVVARDSRTIICDSNKNQFPQTDLAKADLITMLGGVESLRDVATFFSNLRELGRPALITYCTTDDVGDPDYRRKLGWVNDFSYKSFTALLEEAGFSVRRADRVDSVQHIFLLHPGKKKLPALKRVAVLSYYNDGNFGDRLGYHLVNDILPPHAQVTKLSFRPWAPTEEKYDLLLLGMGNSLYSEILNENLLSLIDQCRHTIGIFGTQYHATIQGKILESVLERLDHWYARYDDDVRRYGRNRKNVSHLGDWLIRAFPLTTPTKFERLDIGEEIRQDLPLDRTIQKIQQYATVFSTRLHPLLCSLTSAERVGYREQREMKNGVVSGKFRAMLLDVFGRSFPEEELWEVDRDAVLGYKLQVESRVDQLKARVRGLLT